MTEKQKLFEKFRPFLVGIHIALAETRNRYARSALGPAWITIQTGVFIFVVGAVVGRVFEQDFALFFSWFSISYVLWMFFSGLLLDSSQMYSTAAGLIKDRGVPIPALFFLSLSRQIILLAHTIVIPLVVIIFLQASSLQNFFLAMPGLLLFLAFCAFLSPNIAIVAVRFGDSRPILEALMQITFLISPILWPVSVFEERAPFALWLNPISHLMAIWRDPLFYGNFPVGSFSFVFVVTVFLGIIFVRRYHSASRVAVWL